MFVETNATGALPSHASYLEIVEAVDVTARVHYLKSNWQKTGQRRASLHLRLCENVALKCIG